MWTAIYIYKTIFIPRAAKLREAKAFGLGVILMVANVAALLLAASLQLILSGSFTVEFTKYIFGYTKAGLLLGTGLGLGFELGERLIKKSRH